MKDELLLAILFFGFRFFAASFPGTSDSDALPSPNAGVLVDVDATFMLPVVDVPAPPSLLISADCRPSFGCSCISCIGNCRPGLAN
jgi:hypothetical protein